MIFNQYHPATISDTGRKRSGAFPERGLQNLAQRKQDAQADFTESAGASVGSAYSQLAKAYLSAIEDKLDEATLITLKVLETNSDLVEANLLAGKLFLVKGHRKGVTVSN